MRIHALLALACGLLTSAPAPAVAQQLAFERSFDVSDAPALDVSTIRGAIDVTVGTPDRIIVAGTVTVRFGWDVPANAAELARKVADHSPIERDGNRIQLRPPSGAEERRAVTVSYQIQVPPTTKVAALSESGATTVHGVMGPVTVRTQSGAIELNRLGGNVDVTSGSGSVTIDDVAGALIVTTSSSAITGRSLAGSLRVRTSSGAVDAALSGDGDVDVQTGSSAVRLRGVRGGLIASSQSGRVSVQGAPARSWDTSTGSGSLEISIDARTAFSVEAASRSGSVRIDGASVHGAASKRRVTGTISGGGPLVRAQSRSGSIRVHVASAVVSGTSRSR